MANKFYMETKKDTLEQSVLDVWKEAAEMHAEGMDGRTKEYRSHRSKLETNRTRKENKKDTVKTEQPETEHGSGEYSYEVGTNRYAAYTELVTPGQHNEEVKLDEASDRLFEQIEGMTDEEFDGLLEKADEMELEGILGAIGRGIKKVAKAGSAQSRLARAKKKGDKIGAKINLVKQKTANVAKKKELKQLKKANPGAIRKTAKKIGGALKKSTEANMTENTSLRETIINMWKEAASSAVDPNEREELDKKPDGRGGAVTAKKMKRAAEPAPAIAAEEKIDETNKNDKSDDGEGLDAVQKDAVKKKFKDRKDKDIDNDGDTDDSDKYLHKRRKAVTKAVKADEEVTWEQAQEFKVQSMRDALRQVWKLDEYITKEGSRKKVNGGDGRRMEVKEKNKKTSNEDHEPGHDEDDDEKKEKTLTGKKKAAVDVNPHLQAQKY